MNNWPPARLFAPPIELTVQSIVSPCRAPAAGTVAVTVTKATFLTSSFSSSGPRLPVGVPIN